ncbi:ion channel [Salipaludibacillus sp. LMS25]|jgi:voltage-gated potassium channel|uniref:potassium channel family protein n=1 Tax=Salipaludibacillus sp. LMS25 TaxID=2924031 RepID=UPI0020D0DD44|nr:ion channel [Salipaludibacillus sp. LMS25]UTR15789.1 ion channel [Salipaludibacillus sp. LMS25]
MFRETLLSELYAKKMILLKIILGVSLFVTLAGAAIHTLEPNAYDSLLDGIWWAIVTISTVGYGDFVPKSITGRLLGILLIVVGIALFSFFITNLAASTLLIKEQSEKGLGTAQHASHLLIIGWNERSKLLIEQTHQLYPYKSIVLVDETLQQLPFQYRYVRFIKGNPKLDETLTRANIGQADTIVITASLHVEEKLADANTILTLLTVKGLAPTTYTIAELLTSEQYKNAKRAGADEIIEASQHVGMLLTNGTHHHGLIDVIRKLITQNQTEHLCIAPLPHDYIGKMFGDICGQVSTSDQFLLGLYRSNEAILHPSEKCVLQQGDELIYVKR